MLCRGAVVGPVWNCAKAGAFCAEAFASQRWKSSSKKLPKATDLDFHGRRQFPQAFLSFLVLFSFFVEKGSFVEIGKSGLRIRLI